MTLEDQEEKSKYTVYQSKKVTTQPDEDFDTLEQSIINDDG
jgi:hypothetical protein